LIGKVNCIVVRSVAGLVVEGFVFGTFAIGALFANIGDATLPWMLAPYEDEKDNNCGVALR
jgi:hypothetical protein